MKMFKKLRPKKLILKILKIARIPKVNINNSKFIYKIY